VIVTTMIDTGIGAAAALHLAATLPRPIPACGLATGPLLATDLLVGPLLMSDGEMNLPAGPGLGVALDEARLARYATEAEAAVGF
jgi:L-alanine-DL-glutamate epimerase-like enolase superfamily enzyme